MLRATRVLCASAVKRTTGIVGLDVVPDARAVLIRLYEKTLSDIKASLRMRGACIDAPAGRVHGRRVPARRRGARLASVPPVDD